MPDFLSAARFTKHYLSAAHPVAPHRRAFTPPVFAKFLMLIRVISYFSFKNRVCNCWQAHW